MEYDSRGRVTKEHHADGTETTYTYDKTKVTVQSPMGTKTTEYDEEGNILQVTDNNSVINYTYTSLGKPSTITSGNNTVTLEYDGAGRRISLSDPDAGTQTYSYAADGTLLSQTDANGITVSYVYDAKGRLTGRLGGDCDETTVYGTNGTSRNRVSSRHTDTGFSENYTYDSLGRMTSISRQMDSWGTYNKSFEYDSLGRKVKASYPGNVDVRYEYDDDGNMTHIVIKDRYNQDFNVLDTWKYDGLKKVSFFGDISCTDSYYPATGRLACRTFNVLEGEELERINYSYDDATGNITNRWFGCAEGNRKNNVSGVMMPPMDPQLYRVESFEYDNSDRLISSSVGGSDVTSAQSRSFLYDEDGNITYKSGIGSYGYSEDKPHAVDAVYSPEQDVSNSEQTIVYSRDGKLETLIQRKNGSTSVLTNYFGLDQEKWVSVQNVASRRNPLEVIYFDDYEKITEGNDVTEQYFLENDVILIKKNGILTQYKAFKDAHGSILYIVDKSGNHVFEATYDAWGKQTVTLNIIGLRYGYTGHEMLPDFEVIDMGGRVYDPALGRFLSCDNYVQEPTNSQNFNRYSYCLNNPLRYTDPTGQLFGIDDAVLAFAAFNLTSSLMQAYASGENMWTAVGRSILGSAASFGIGQAFGPLGSFWHEAARAGAHGLASGVTTMFAGGNFYSGFISGATSSGMGSFAQSVNMPIEAMIGTTAAMGGIASLITGESFWQGAINGLTIGALNHSLHGMPYKRLSNGKYEATELLDDVICLGKNKSWIVDLFALGNTVFDGFGTSLKNYSGNSTFASNGKFYFNGFNSRGFYGNQYVKAVRLESIGKSIIKVTGPADKFCNIYYIGKGLSYDISNYRKYGSTNGYSTVKAVSKWTGGLAGGLVGAKLGAVAGLSCGGIGTVPGSIIGGAAGGIFGAWGGSSFSETIIDRMYNIW